MWSTWTWPSSFIRGMLSLLCHDVTFAEKGLERCIGLNCIKTAAVNIVGLSGHCLLFMKNKMSLQHQFGLLQRQLLP